MMPTLLDCGCEVTSWRRCRFGTRYLCWRCARDGRETHAVVRIFSGMEGSGWPACADHVNAAATAALRPLLTPDPKYPLHSAYEVRAYEVVRRGDDGFAYLGRLLWSARRRVPIPDRSAELQATGEPVDTEA